MATSKLPCDYVMVPDSVLQYAAEHPEVHCNLRLEQRVLPETEEEKQRWFLESHWDSFEVKPIADFLKNLSNGCRVAIYLQGYDTETGTAVVNLNRVFWTSDSYPRLDFVQPEGMAEVHGCPNFWGAFILAITKVDLQAPVGFWPDADAGKFLEIARQYAI